MADIVKFKPRTKMSEYGVPVILKVVDGETIELVCIDDMTPENRARYFADSKPSSD